MTMNNCSVTKRFVQNSTLNTVENYFKVNSRNLFSFLKEFGVAF